MPLLSDFSSRELCKSIPGAAHAVPYAGTRRRLHYCLWGGGSSTCMHASSATKQGNQSETSDASICSMGRAAAAILESNLLR